MKSPVDTTFSARVELLKVLDLLNDPALDYDLLMFAQHFVRLRFPDAPTRPARLPKRVRRIVPMVAGALFALTYAL